MNFFACSRGRSAAHTASRSASAKTINSSVNISPQSSGKRFFPRIAQILWKTHGGRFSPATSRDAAKNFAAKYGYTYPDYDENVSRYVRDMYAEYEAK